MLRRIARWLISRSIDEGRHVPQWLRKWIERDDKLKDFETLSQRLGAQLKDDAADWISSQKLPRRVETVLPRRLVRPNAVSHRRKRAVRGAVGAMLFGTTAAACVWFTMSHSRSPTDQAKQPKPEETRHIVKENPAVPITAADREWLQTAWRRSRANLSQLHERATNLPGRSDLLNVSGYSAIIEPAETAGSATGRALAMLDRGMTSQQQQLTSDSRAAVSFFVERLPASLAKLVRWKKRQ